MVRMTHLWKEHHSRLRSYVAKRVRERDAVDDILQEVFLKVNAGLHTVKAQGAISAWLYRVAANSIADHFRSQKPWDELPGDDELPTDAPESSLSRQRTFHLPVLRLLSLSTPSSPSLIP